MENVNACTQALIKAIQESEEYIHFSKLRDQVKEQPELRRQINEFRLLVFQVQNCQEPLDMYAEQLRLCRDYEEFRKDTLVNDFLQAELRICRMLQKITEDVADAVDLDSDEVSERIGL